MRKEAGRSSLFTSYHLIAKLYILILIAEGKMR